MSNISSKAEERAARFNTMANRIKSLEAELKALKVSIPQIQHDAIINTIIDMGEDYHYHDGRDGQWSEYVIDLCDVKLLAANILTQTEQSDARS